jgi:hypothetical protein
MSGVEGGDELGAKWRGRAGRRDSGGELPGGMPYRQEAGAPFSFLGRIDTDAAAWQAQPAVSVSPSNLNGPSVTPLRPFRRTWTDGLADVHVHLHPDRLRIFRICMQIIPGDIRLLISTNKIEKRPVVGTSLRNYPEFLKYLHETATAKLNKSV